MAVGDQFAGLVAGAALGTLFVKLTAESTELVKGMAEAELSVEHGASVIQHHVTEMSLVLAALFAEVGIEAVKEFAKFDDAMTKSTAKMLGLTEATKKQMEDLAHSIASNATTSVVDLAKAYGALDNAGFSAEQSMKALHVAQTFSSASATEMVAATNQLTSAQVGLGLVSKDATENMENLSRVSDVIVRSAQLGHGSIEQFGEAIGGSARLFKQFHIELEQGAAILAAWSQKGVNVSEVSQNLGLVLRQLQHNALENANAFTAFGIQVFDSSGKMEPFPKILASIDRAMEGMSDSQKRTTFTLLGFQDRSLKTIQSLLGMSERVREFETALGHAGGAAEQVSEKQMESLNSQLKITQNRLEMLLEAFGEGLVPVIREFNNYLKSVTSDGDKMNKVLADAAHIVGDGMVIAFKGLGMIIEGMVDSFRLAAIGILGVAEYTLKGIDVAAHAVANLIAGIVNSLVDGINAAIRAINSLVIPEWARQRLGIGPMINEIQLKVTVDDKNSKAIQWLKGVETELHDARESISNDLTGLYNTQEKTAKRTVEAVGETTKKVTEAVKEAVDNTRNAIDETSRAATAFLDKISGVSEKDRVDLAAIYLMGVKDPTAEQLKNAKDFASASQAEAFKRQLGKETFGGLDPSIAKGLQNQDEIAAATKNLKILKTIGEQEVQLSADVNKRRLEMMQAYNEKLRALHLAQAQIAVQAGQQTFDSLAQIAASFAGKQSGIYKAMFAVSKAFAIADSVIKIQQGIAAAASLPFPANLAAIASVVAATANIVSTIQSVKLEFAGGRAMGGSVIGGKQYMVGEAGPEMFVPSQDGHIVPNNQLRGPSGGGVKIVVNNYTDARAQVTEKKDGDGRVFEVMIRRVKDEISSEIRDGRGTITKAMENTFKLRRGQ